MTSPRTDPDARVPDLAVRTSAVPWRRETSSAQHELTRMIRALGPSRSRPWPERTDATLQQHAARILGTGPLAWVAETSAACSELVLTRHADLSDALEPLARNTEENLIVVLCALAGAPDPRGLRPAHPEIMREIVFRDVPLDHCMAILRTMQHCWTESLVAHAVAWKATPDTQLDVRLATTRMMDQFLDEQIQDYAAALELRARGATTRRGAMISDLLRGRPVDAVRAQDLLGTDLRADHLAMVLISDDRTPRGVDDLRLCAARVGRELESDAVVRHEPSKGVYWLWATGPPGSFGGAVRLSRAVGDRTRVGVGGPHPGATGFRRSHLQAVDAVRYTQCGRWGPVVLHRDIALTSLLGRDPERARWFVEATLGSLAGPDDDARELRHTLACYYGSQMRLVDAARELKVHRNTLIRRLDRIETLLGHAVEDEVAEVASAILIIDRGPGVGEDRG